MKLKISEDLGIDADNILTSRTCVLSQSGGGKSYGIAVICEELCKNKLGFAVIDPEGEYSGLKEKYDILWLGNNPNADASFENSDLDNTARVVVDSGFPIIADVSDEKDENETVKRFCEALYNACDKLRKPYLLIVEEADKYSPNKGKQLEIIEEVARRGRK
jgi:DNA helicase HerA-like ATPase